MVEGAQTINRKIEGQRASAAPAPIIPATDGNNTDTIQPAKPVIISASQQSFDNIIEHFNGLVALLSSHAEYNPNEADLKITALQSVQSGLKAANNAISTGDTAWSNSRISRDTILYAENTGIADTATVVKAYIKLLLSEMIQN